MKLALCQLDSKWEDCRYNIEACNRAIDAYIDLNGTPDIFVFPEFFSYGYTMDNSFAENCENGITLRWLVEKSEQIGCAICGSVPVRYDDNRAYNCFYFVSEDGVIRRYNKRHPFTAAGEDKYYAAGMNQLIFNYRGWNIALSVCYDLRFPVWLRNVKKSYDLMLNVANWPDVRIETARLLARARAIENVCYMAFCNRVGSDTSCNYNGGSIIANSKGEDISVMESIGGFSFVTANLDKESLESFRASSSIWRDGDSFNIEY